MAVWSLMAGSSGYTDPLSGTVYPAGARVNAIIYDGVAPYTPEAGLVLTNDGGGQIHQPPQPPRTTIAAYDFINRLTPAEQGAIMGARPMWGVQIAALGMVDVTNPTLLADFAAAVAGGLLTQARATQILNLSVPSP